MSARSQGFIDNLIRGHETLSFRIKMLVRMALKISIFSAAVWSMLLFAALKLQTDADTFDGLKAYGKSYLMVLIGRGNSNVSISIHGFGQRAVEPETFIEVNRQWFEREARSKLETAALLATFGASILALAILHLWHRFGAHKGASDYLRGGRLVDARTLTRNIQDSKDGAGQFRLVGVPFPSNKVLRNVLLTGAMGSGKSVACCDLMKQCFEAGRKAIIYDKSGEYTALFFRPDVDLILNPFDARFCGYDLFAELRDVYDFEQITHSLIAAPDGADASTSFFHDAARVLFAEALRIIFRDGGAMPELDRFLKSSAQDKIDFVQGTRAAQFLGTKDSDQTAGVIATLGSAVKAFEYLPAGSFSVRDWVARDDDSRLFLPSHANLHDTIRPFYSMIIDIAIRALMAGQITHHEDRLWAFLDELASLNYLHVLHTSLTEGRKYGLVHVVGLQNIAQLRMVFGRDATQTMRSNLQNLLVLRVTDEETQEAYSKLLGAEELDESNENISIGSAATRDGAGVQASRQERTLVMPAEIGLLPDCAGFLKMAGAFNPARVVFPFNPMLKPQQPAFVPRADLALRRYADPAMSAPTHIVSRGL